MLLYQSQDTGIFANLLDKAKDTPGVVFHSAVGKEELANDLAKTHVLLYPNYFPETSCISAIEAVTSGCAIVTTSEGALPETISNCSGGLDNHHIFDLPLKQSVRDQLKVSSDYVSRIITSQDLDNG
jgi:glycosyltransferase involved in cell wall biosynthesis